VENAHEGILLIINEKAAYANNALITMSGYNEKDFYALDILNDFFPDNEKGKLLVQKNYYDRISGSTKSSQYEAQILRKDGSTQDVIISASPILIQGEPGSLCIITNISQLKEAQHTITRQFNEIERQYRELESLNSELISVQSELIGAHEKTSRQMQQLEATLRSIGDAVITTDTGGNILMINEETERITQLSSNDVRGKPFSETISLYLQSSQTPIDPVDQILQTGRFSHSATPLVLRKKDGTERTVEIRGTRILLENNTIFGAVMAIRDVTEKHKLEQEILKMSKIESIGVLAGGIAHDFNNLLTAVIGNTALARNNAGNEEKLTKYLSMIEGAAKRAVALTQQLLTFSKGGSPRKQVTSITALLHECAEFILMGSNIKPVYEFEDNIWPVQIDVNQMSHVFNNILINAKHAMPEGGTIMISANNIISPPEDIPLFQRSHVRIAISDQGPGIPDENLSRIFDPYFSTKVQGSGLGLASSYSIIKKHKGHIVATSEPGKGATFTIYLQASDEPLPDEKVPDQPPGTGRGKVLLMDDEEYILETTGEMLRDLGYDVTTAPDGAAAITLYREALDSDNSFDIVIMDLTIPGGMGGKEALAELLTVHPEVKAIVSSGYSDEIILSNYNDYGFIDYLSKPYTFQDIAKILKTHLSTEKKS
jgi:PAS domain S-box-containing protein